MLKEYANLLLSLDKEIGMAKCLPNDATNEVHYEKLKLQSTEIVKSLNNQVKNVISALNEYAKKL